eukprot:5742960-Pyramimonas_sp.AAC.1
MAEASGATPSTSSIFGGSIPVLQRDGRRGGQERGCWQGREDATTHAHAQWGGERWMGSGNPTYT